MMLKAYSEARNRCYLHPHRQAETRCERCSTPLCAECARTFDGKQLCEHCVEELSYIEATKPTFRDHAREFFTSLRNTLIIVAVVVAVCAGLFVVLRPFFNQPLTPEELARFRYAAGGSFQTPEGINVNSTVLGAKVVSFTSERKGFEATHLINEYVGDGYPGWRSATATFPQDVVVEQQDVSAVSKVILTQQPGEPADTEARDFEVDASTAGPDGPWTKLGQWQLSPAAGPQRFTFPVAQAHWLRLRILSNDGSADYTSLGEFDAYVVQQQAGGTPTP